MGAIAGKPGALCVTGRTPHAPCSTAAMACWRISARRRGRRHDTTDPTLTVELGTSEERRGRSTSCGRCRQQGRGLGRKLDFVAAAGGGVPELKPLLEPMRHHPLPRRNGPAVDEADRQPAGGGADGLAGRGAGGFPEPGWTHGGDGRARRRRLQLAAHPQCGRATLAGINQPSFYLRHMLRTAADRRFAPGSTCR